MNIILCGMPGSGKSTLSRLVAQEMHRPLLATDQELERMYGQQVSCRQIYQTLGEKAFRELEGNVLAGLPVSGHVIDIGGGALSCAANARIVKSLGILYYLKIGREAGFERLMRKGLPAYLEPSDPYGSFVKLAQIREPLFEQYADCIVDASDLSNRDILSKILDYARLQTSA